MGKNLSDHELKQVLDRLRDQYRELAARYGAGFFNIDRLEDRYLATLRAGASLTAFLAGEVAALQELKTRAEEKTAPKSTEVSDRADRMLEEFARRISKYPLVDPDGRLDEETGRLVGMLAGFYKRFAGLLAPAHSLPPGSRLARLAETLSERAFRLLEPGARGRSRAVEDLLLELSRPGAPTERIRKEFFKEVGFLLNQIADFLGELAAAGIVRDPDLLATARQHAAEALIDFRLGEFRLKG
jgi:hypothetical protein